MNDKLLTPYNPEDTEKRIYKEWEEAGFFNPDICIEKGITKADAPTFSIVLPPPNVTGVLHLGHAVTLTIEDIIVRYNRMKGHRTLWLPGTDHAAIATQSKVEKLLEKEKLNKYEMGREPFLDRVREFAKNSHDTIVSQSRRMGASLDWSREAFTLDDKRNLAVRTAFKKMYDDGLIYRGYRVVNWDPKGQTVISDDEIVYEERKAKFYTFKYSKDFPISISTTRPETKVGDTAVAVNPEDERYKEYIGKTYEVVFCGAPLKIKIIADEACEKDFGTGALGVTPAHSQIDADIAQRHNLPMVQVIDERARMMVGDERILGKKAAEAREIIAQYLRDEGLMEKEEEITQNVSTAERTGAIIEPLPKMQWFVSANKEFTIKESHIKGIESGSKVSLKKLMQAAVAGGDVEIIPDRFNTTYFRWIDNLRDWCISRQIWYGHRIPVWYKEDEIYCDVNPPEGDGWKQDEDTLDTWFSSGLWTFSTMGWPDLEALDFKNYRKTQLLETGYDIIFFWVARMILMTTYLLGEVPFEKVYLHGLVRDAKGQKMSKSKGNAADPIELADKYGTDALRMSCVVGTGPGADLIFMEDKVRAYKKYANKIWNISRFIIERTENILVNISEKPKLTEKDEDAIRELNETIDYVEKHIIEYKLHLASEHLYHYTWHTLADIVIEERKEILQNGTDEEKISAAWTLHTILETVLKMNHPFMPFITEELWAILGDKELPLIVTPWPSKM